MHRALPMLLAEKEIIERSTQAEMTPDRVRELIMDATGDELEAERQAAKYSLEVAKAKARAHD